MIPDKPGYWRMESGNGNRRIAEVIQVNDHLEMILPGFSNSFSLRHTCVDRWLGPVVDPFADVVEFHQAMFPHLIGKHGPEIPEASTKNLRLDLIFEEYREMIMGIHSDDMVEIVDGALDLMYVVLGMLCTYGVNPWPIWQAIHASNMAKADGPIREDGKKCKPPGWQPPPVRELLIAQGWTPPDGV